MSSYSAAQVISPAIERTKWFLFRPFRLGTFLKLALVAALTEGGGISGFNLSSPFPMSHSGGGSGGNNVPFHWPAIHWPPMPIIVGVIAVACAILIPLYLLVSYLIIRLRFTYFDCLLRGERRIGSAWGRYPRQALRYLVLTLLIAVAFWAVLIPLGFALYFHFKPLFVALVAGDGKHLPWGDLIAFFLIFFLVVLALALIGSMLDAMLASCVLPRMALVDASIGEALEEVWADIKAEPGQFLLFYFLRGLLAAVASFVGSIALIIPFAIVAVIGAILIIALKAVSVIAALVVGIPLGILLVAAFLTGIIGVTGTIGTFRRNYALFFYAGRFPEMAAILWPRNQV